MALLIRPFQERDRAAVIELWDEAFPDDPAHNVSAHMIDTKLRVQPELFLVAEDDCTLLGTVMAGFDGVRGWLHRLAVRSAARRRGIGRALIRAAEDGMLALGCPKVNLQVRTTNTQVIAFYRALGYDVEERVQMGKRL